MTGREFERTEFVGPVARGRPGSAWLALLAGYVVVYIAWLLFSWPFLDPIGYVTEKPIVAIGALVAWQASLRARPWARTTLAWRLMSLGLVGQLAGEIATDVYELLGKSPYPSLADPLYLSFYPLMLAALLVLTGARPTRPERVMLGLDLTITAPGASAVVWYFLIAPTARVGGQSTLQTAFSLAYPVGDVILIVGVAALLLRGVAVGMRTALWLMIAGLCLYVVGDGLYAYATLNGGFGKGDVLNITYAVALSLFVLAARSQTSTNPAERSPETVRRSRRVSWMPYLAVAAGFSVLVTSEVVRESSLVVVLLVTALAIVVSARQFVAQLALVGMQRQLRELATIDALTGLGNRRAADERLEAWAGDPTDALRLTVVLCDVNGLKMVNDTHGHLVGDRLIREVGAFVSAAAGRLPQGVAARVGGDEFLIASPCPDQLLVQDVIDELTRAAGRLPLGGGLSCGSAWAGELIRPEASPQSLVCSLLRMADSRQYRRKCSARTGGPPHEILARREGHQTARAWRDALPPLTPLLNPQPAVNATGATATHVDADPGGTGVWFTHLDEHASVKQRLEHAAQGLSTRAGAVAWWVSTVDQAAGTVHAVACGTTRTDDMTDGLWPAVEIDPTIYQISDFPLTARAVRGEHFSSDTRTGDPAEQRLLIQLGFQSMIAAGGTDDTGLGWLVEIYGDSLTSSLHTMAETPHRAATSAIVSSPRLPDLMPSGTVEAPFARGRA